MHAGPRGDFGDGAVGVTATPFHKPLLPRAERTETGGWRITLPLEIHSGRTRYDVCPSKNRGGRHEHRARYTARRNAITSTLVGLLAESRPPRLWHRTKTTRIGNIVAPVEDDCVFLHAQMTLTLYHRTKAILRSDPQNWISGCEALLDSLVNAGWLYDDDRQHLSLAEPVLCVDKDNPRITVDLETWDGVKE